MEEKELAEKKVETASTDADKSAEPLQPVPKPKYTPQEKVAYNLKKIAEEARRLGVDPSDIVGATIKLDEGLPDETPLTVGTFKEMQRKEAQNTSLQLADSIEDEAERNEVKNILENHIKPSGDSQKDFNLAQAAANAVRTEQIAREQARKTQATRTAAGGSSPSKQEDRFEATENEAAFMAPPWNLSKEKILEARAKEQAKRG